MTGVNSYLSQQAATIASPLTFTSTAGAADGAAAMTRVRANLDLVIALISIEEVDASVNRFFLDEMSPAARNVLYKILTDLKTASPAP